MQQGEQRRLTPILLQGRCEGDSSDVGFIFRQVQELCHDMSEVRGFKRFYNKQESYFHWCFGVLEPDYFGAVDVVSGRSVLYIPKLDEDYAIIMGHIPTPEELRDRYRVDEVRYIDEMPDSLRTLTSAPPTLLLLEGPNTDSGKMARPAAFDGMSKFKTDKTILFHQIAETRVYKTPMELDVLRYASKISSLAHMHVMRTMKPGMKEYQAESTFLHHVYFHGGARHVCYNCIAATGQSAAVLHYGHAGAPNDQTLRDGDMVLFDMGAEYCCYNSDITCSWPVNGKFTEKQKVTSLSRVCLFMIAFNRSSTMLC